MEPIKIQDIQKFLPHRYPFLLVDRVVELEPMKRVKAYKNVTANEDFFNGHFPGHPVMPGVLIIEALAQATALLALRSGTFDLDKQVFYLAGIDGARFKKPVVPGDRLDLEGTIIKQKGMLWKMSGVATVDGEKVAEAELLATVVGK